MTDLDRLKRRALAGGDPEAARAYLRELERRGRLARWGWLREAATMAHIKNTFRRLVTQDFERVQLYATDTFTLNGES